jgi:hypothetical protein
MTISPHPSQEALTRRGALSSLGHGVGSVLLAAAMPACARPSPPGESDDDLLQRAMTSAAPRIAARDTPYRLTRSLRIPAGRTVTIDEGVRLSWTGPTGESTGLVGVFVADGPNTGVVAEGRGAFVECASPSPFVYAALMRGFSGFVVSGLYARECQHVHVTASADHHAAVRVDGPDANVARDVRIVGGGASYATPQSIGHGACFLYFAASCDVRNAQYRNVANGVQWWGGNADPVRPPADGGPHSERKCRDILIQNVSAEGIAGAGIWGSMGRNVTVRDCTVAEVADVGFDAEGSQQVTFERCTARNARNGCFATFFLCNGIRFVDCTGIVDDKNFPLLRVYNESQVNNYNTGLEIVGGTFECRDRTGPGTIDTANGPVGTFSLTGSTLNNVRIDVAYSNMHRTIIDNNNINLPYQLGGAAAIKAGSSKSLQGAAHIVPGAVVIEQNTIRYSPAAGQGNATAILLREDDFNSAARDQITNNRIIGPFATGISVVNASGNVGITPDFVITGNRFVSMAPQARLLEIGREGAQAAKPDVQWDAAQTRDGRAVPLVAALR